MSDEGRDVRGSRRAGSLIGVAVVSLLGSLTALSVVPGPASPPQVPTTASPRAMSSAPPSSGRVSLEASAHGPAGRRAEARASAGRDVEEKRRGEALGERRAPHPTGKLLSAPGASDLHGSGVLRRFTVEVEQGLGVRPARFAAQVEDILFSPRGWTRGDVSFRRVPGPIAEFHVILAGRRLTDRLCAPALTHGRLSCHNDGKVVVNFWRWVNGASAYRGRLDRYRIYVVNHEVGHALGKGHLGCPARGAPAPVMMQQTLGVAPCRARPWPAPYEVG